MSLARMTSFAIDGEVIKEIKNVKPIARKSGERVGMAFGYDVVEIPQEVGLKATYVVPGDKKAFDFRKKVKNSTITIGQSNGEVHTYTECSVLNIEDGERDNRKEITIEVEFFAKDLIVK